MLPARRPSSRDNAHESSFAVQYFRTSQRLQQLKDEITQHAWEERNQKRAELEALNTGGNHLNIRPQR
jgi:hypothetical protein